MQNGQMTNYIMPTSSDLPPIRVFFEELGNVHGAYGAKGIGELPMDGPAPAIVNAVEDALGVRFDSVPLLPEDIMDALDRQALATSSQMSDASPSSGGR
jgi:CO/xanthine dehydrogenase Mo-binding subunit